MKKYLLLAVAAGSLALVGCGGDETPAKTDAIPKAPKADKAPAAPAAPAVPPAPAAPKP